jgi:hypothetical protein
VRVRTVTAATALSVGLAALVAWLADWSFQRAALLAPVLVASAGAVAALGVLWTRIAWESLRDAKHPRWIVVVGVGAVALLVGLSLLGLKLPRE